MQQSIRRVGRLSLAFAIFLLPSIGSAQITEIIDATGDGAGNTLNGAFGIAADGSGNVYVADGNSTFKITPAGVITEILDGGSVDIAVDGAGNVYVTGGNNDNAFKITPGGTITQIIDATGDGAGNVLDSAIGVTTDGAGNVYVTGRHSDNAFKITPGGTITQIIDTTGDGVGNTLLVPHGIAVDGAGNVYVAGSISHNAFKITPGGTITQIIDISGDGTNPLIFPSDNSVAADGLGNVYVSGQTSDNAFRITPGGTITQIIDATGDGAGHPLESPTGIAVDGAGNVYVAGAQSHNAFKLTPGGTITQIIDATGDGAGNPLSLPLDIAVDASGNVYVAGLFSNNAFKIEAAECFLVLGSGPGITAFTPGSHTFWPQVSGLRIYYPVLMNDIPEFLLPTTVGQSSPLALSPLGHFRGASSGGLHERGLGGYQIYWAQVLMWNPEVFPGQPEQRTPGMRVVVTPDGRVYSSHYGDSTGMEIWTETGVNAQGEPVLRFPFSIPGF